MTSHSPLLLLMLDLVAVVFEDSRIAKHVPGRRCLGSGAALRHSVLCCELYAYFFEALAVIHTGDMGDG